MYTLRTISPKGKPTNQLIGKIYSESNRFQDYDEFCHFYKTIFGVEHVADLDPSSDYHSKSCYSFLLCGQEIIPLYNENDYYIMSESGKTFSNLTNKK